MTMRKATFSSNLIVSLFMMLLLISCSEPDKSKENSSKQNTWHEVKEAGHGYVRALFVQAEGFAHFDHQGHLTGVTVELLRDFAQYLDKQYNITLHLHFEEEKDWRAFYQHVVHADDGVIGFGNVTITEARKQELAFSPAYMTNIASLITHAKAPTLDKLENLAEVFAGRQALAFAGTLHEERLRGLLQRYYPEAVIQLAYSNDEMIEKIGAQDNYFAYIDLYNYWRAIDRGVQLQRHEVADEAAEQFGYIMPLGSSWEPIIREYFEHGPGLTSTARYRAIMEEHLGTELASVLMQSGTTPNP